jgi:hypothetical protein
VSGAGELDNGDVLLGGAPGPDSDAWFLNADVYPRGNWLVSAGVFGHRIGARNRDMSYFDVHVDPKDPPFPSGVVEETIGLRMRTRWELPGNRWIAADYARVQTDNLGNEAGVDDTSDAFRVEIRWDFP